MLKYLRWLEAALFIMAMLGFVAGGGWWSSVAALQAAMLYWAYSPTGRRLIYEAGLAERT